MTQPGTGISYAGVVTRAIALVIDVLIINVISLAVGGAVALVKSVFSLGHGNHAIVAALGIAAFALWVISYFAVFWSTTGQTPGSRVMQIQVTRNDGSCLHPVGGLVRLAGMVLSMPLFWGYLPILWSRHRRGICDLMAGTVVTGVPPAPGEPEWSAPREPYLAHRERSGEDRPTAGARSNRHLAAQGGKTIA
jgi:uncharacterized RDD family membrane protein YckC